VKNDRNLSEEIELGFKKIQFYRTTSFTLLGIGFSNGAKASERRFILDDDWEEFADFIDAIQMRRIHPDLVAKYLVTLDKDFAESLSLKIGFELMDQENNDDGN